MGFCISLLVSTAYDSSLLSSGFNFFDLSHIFLFLHPEPRASRLADRHSCVAAKFPVGARRRSACAQRLGRQVMDSRLVQSHEAKSLCKQPGQAVGQSLRRIGGGLVHMRDDDVAASDRL
jgi:hypothetical protein